VTWVLSLHIKQVADSGNLCLDVELNDRLWCWSMRGVCMTSNVGKITSVLHGDWVFRDSVRVIGGNK